MDQKKISLINVRNLKMHFLRLFEQFYRLGFIKLDLNCLLEKVLNCDPHFI